jgi:5-formyltetrahydrofolate cyclo-ligase
MTKEELRKLYIKKRSSLSDAEYHELNDELCRIFFKSVDLSGIKILHSFLPIERQKEPNTRQIILQIMESRPDLQIAIPRVNDATQTLENILLESTTVLKSSGWGIPEPESGVVIDPDKIGMVLVPMLIFDRRGHRVGYGKGFYDKFLFTTSHNCKRVGICLFDPVERIDNIEGFDERLDQCITPSGSYIF